MEHGKTPKIRFHGFNDNWEVRKLGEVANVYDGIHQTPDYKTDGIMFLSVENINTLKSEKYISQDDFERNYRVYPQKGDVLMTRIGDVGTPNVVETSEKLAFYVSLALLKPFGISSYFLCNSIQSPFFRKGLKNRTLVTAIPQKINKDEIGKIDIPLPTHAEQQRIGEYFSRLDDLIGLYKRKLEKSLNLKKAMLAKMFPQNGKPTPQIRFAGFNDNWEVRKLGEVMNVTSVKRIHQSDWTNSGIRFLRAREIVAAAKGEEPSDYLYISKNKYDECTALSGKVSVNDILVTGVGTIGVPYLIINSEPLYFKDGNVIWFQNNEKINGKFFYFSFTGSYIQSFIQDNAGIGTVGTYTIETGKITPIPLPTHAEQQRIGEYFSRLDDLIGLYKRKLEKSLNLKKAMLEKMFP